MKNRIFILIMLIILTTTTTPSQKKLEVVYQSYYWEKYVEFCRDTHYVICNTGEAQSDLSNLTYVSKLEIIQSYLNRFTYKSDIDDEWVILDANHTEGDCEDFALSSLEFILMNKLFKPQDVSFNISILTEGVHAWIQIPGRQISNNLIIQDTFYPVDKIFFTGFIRTEDNTTIPE